MSSSPDKAWDLAAIDLWTLPLNFFNLEAELQWALLEKATRKADRLAKPLPPCTLSLFEELTAITYFLAIMGFPLLAFFVTICLLMARSAYVLWWLLLLGCLSSHPCTPFLLWYRQSWVQVCVAKYLTFTVLVDRNDEVMRPWGTREVLKRPLPVPAVIAACPHGVLNFGAGCFVAFGPFLQGRYQYSVAAAVTQKIPMLRYLNLSVWGIHADRASIQRALRQEPTDTASEMVKLGKPAVQCGGCVGINPDGIAGIFKGSPGKEVLYLGKKRGLMNICAEEGALMVVQWYAGILDQFTVLQDPMGILETLSRRLRVSLFLFYGRWGLPLPRRVPVVVCNRVVQFKKTISPATEAIEEQFENAYGGLVQDYQEFRHYTGHPDRELTLM